MPNVIPSEKAGVHSPKFIGQLAAALFVASGFVTATSPLLPAPDGMNKPAVLIVGVAAVLAGAVIWILPWERWPRSRSLALAPLALSLIAIHNHVGGVDAYRYGIFFIVAFMWVGIAQPRGTSLYFAPPLLAAYVIPLFTSGHATSVSLASALYVVPVCLLVAETMAWATDRLRRAQETVEQREARFRSLVQSGADVIAVLDATGRVTYISPSNERVTGFPPHEVIGQIGLGRVHPDDLPTMQRVFADLAAQPDTRVRSETRIAHRDGSWLTMEAVVSNMLDDPAVAGFVVNARDITDRKALEEQLVRQAFRDPLTGLANRALFLDRLEHAAERAHRAAESLAVLFIDLDDFKLINDSLGHEAGDQVLRVIAGRISGCLRSSDTVARLGGDEFTVLLEQIESLDEPTTIAERVTQAIAEPVGLNEREFRMQASVGIALLASESAPHLELLRRADVAMYDAKRSGKGRHAVYQSRMDETVLHRMSFESAMRGALENAELVLHYQPIIDFASGAVVEVEALVRWNHPERGLLLPAAFIPFAEETGLIGMLGKWVLRTACAQWQAWHDADPTRRLPVLGVNLSGRQLQQPGIVAEVAAILVETGFPAERLKLEITESVALEETEAITARLDGLRALGVQLAVDDFGTGYAGLRSLRHCPVDTLKIDRQYVTSLGRDDNSDNVVRAVLEFAHRLGLSATAEGVETQEQAMILRSLGCERGQGFLFGRPGPFDVVRGLLADDAPGGWETGHDSRIDPVHKAALHSIDK